MGIFGKKKRLFKESAEILAQEGFSDNYISKLKEEVSQLKKPADIAKGNSYIINGLIVKGDLTEACEAFVKCEAEGSLEKLDKLLYPNLLQNLIFAFFARDKFKEAERLYKEYNDKVLSEHTDAMKRTLAIHECINERYENAVTVLAKILDSDCRFVDFCLVKTVLKLDMYERARELSAGFDEYNGKNELEKEASKLKKKIFDGLSPKDKVKMIKKK